MKDYKKKIDEMIKNSSFENKEEIIKEHLDRISFYQHERLIHLIVTITFAILEMLSLILLSIMSNTLSILLTCLFFILLVPYIFHYYFLENYVQNMYRQYEKLLEI